MALLLRLLSPLPCHRLHCRVVHRRCPARAVAALRKEEGASVVWFKHDLRIDDHPGLVAAVSQHRTVVPFYVFDPRILSGFSDEMLELLIFALEDLRRVLKEQGSDLLIGYGAAEKAVIELVEKVKATHIFAEEEVDYNVRRVVDSVDESLLDKSFSWGSPKLIIWKTPFYEIKDLKETPTSYVDFQKLQLPVTAPIAPPVLPALNADLEIGTLPVHDYLKRYIVENTSQSNEIWSAIKETSAKAIIKQRRINQTDVKAKFALGLEEAKRNEEFSLGLGRTKRRKSMSSLFVEGGNQVRGGTDAVLNALAAYLRYLEGTARDDWQELHQKLREAETRKGASFGMLFRTALRLGIISRRRVHHEALNYERERNGGFLSPFGYSALTVMATVETVCSMEWYSLLALKSQICKRELYPIRIWRWNGYLIQYTVVGKKGPACLLVHGFGAFLEHFRGNLSCMANKGRRVWALTLLGFGKSEKPNVPYTELMWAELLRDFIVDVVSEPVHLVGNSIGGYFVAIVAGLWPAIAKSVVLLNTAGSVVPGYSSAQIITEARQASGIMWLGSRLLLWYLRLRAGSILKGCYPTNSERVDDWLVNEILRASYDPGVPIVMESVVNFNLSVPLNYLVESFGGKVLIIQGIKDPLSKSKLRISMFRENCSGVAVRELDAGHCPHDEVPEEVNLVLYDWVKTTESSIHAVERV